MLPGKGAHLELNDRYLNWLQKVLEDIDICYSDEDADDKAFDPILDSLLESEMNQWTEEKDNFGRKVYVAIPYKEGELRVTVVHTKRGEIKLDIREWFEPKF